MPLPDIDENGIVRSGPFAGLKAEEVFAFAEATASTRRMDEPKPEDKPTPQDALKKAADARTNPMNEFTFSQFERIDEDSFSKTVPDYDKYRERINNVKKTMTAAQRAQQGVHRFIYQNVRMDDPEVQKVIFGVIPPPGEKVETVDDEGNPITPEEEEDKGEAPPPEPPPEPKPKPKAVPSPVAKPTPRAAPPAPAPKVKTTLKATPKVLALAERYAMTVDEYLARLEEQGYTQDQLNNLSMPSSARQTPSSRPRSIYDR